MLHIAFLIIGVVVGMLLVLVTLKTLIATTRYLWKYSLGILILVILAVVLFAESSQKERRYQEYLQTEESYNAP